MAARPCPPQLLRGLPGNERALMRKTYSFMRDHLSPVLRRTGLDYAEHGTEVAMTLREVSDDPSLIRVALLHDILLAKRGELLLKQSPLTASERALSRAMHGLRRLHIDANMKDLDAVLAAFSADPRVLPLRIAHRLNDVRHLERFGARTRTEIARETLHMYGSIAGRLGMYAWKEEMEELCFRFLHPKTAAALQKKIASHGEVDALCLRHTERFLRKKLKEQGMDCAIATRIKGVYSTYRKIILKKRRFEDLTDRLALRIIVKTEADCYRALGIVHGNLHPIPGKLKDFIGSPKENGYRSIHTVIYPLPGVTEQPVEIQIRTEEMDRECEYGPAAHASYKHWTYALHVTASRVDLFRNFESLIAETRSPTRFAAALRMYHREDRLAIFGGDGTLYHLRRPVSALDFALHVHGKRCTYLKGIRVNGRVRGADTLLGDGDTVEALFARTPLAKPDWLQACHLPRSRAVLQDILDAVHGKRRTAAAAPSAASL